GIASHQSPHVGIPHHLVRLDVPAPQPHPGCSKREPQVGLGLGQSCISASVLGDVERHHHHIDSTVFVVDGGHPCLVRRQRAVCAVAFDVITHHSPGLDTLADRRPCHVV